MFIHFRKRPPLFITAALALSVAVCYYAGSTYYNICAIILIAAMTIFTAMLLFSLRGEHYSLIIMALMVLLFSVLGIFSAGQRIKSEEYAKRYIGTVITAEGTVHEAVAINDTDDYSVLLEVERISGKKTERPFYIKFFTDVNKPMARLYDKAVFVINVTDVGNGIYDDTYRENLRSKGIFVVGYGSYVKTVAPRSTLYGFLASALEFIDDKLSFLEYSTLAEALITGDRSYLSDEIKSDFTKAGVSHVLALSGLHISVILLSVHSLFNMLTVHRRIYTVFAVLLLCFYILMTGFSHSVVRASIMAMIMMISSFFSGEYDVLDSLSIALSLILIVDPYAVGSVSFQLSFLATLGIAVLGAPVVKTIKDFSYKKLLKKVHFVLFRYGLQLLLFVVSSLVITAAVMIFTLPVLLVSYDVINIRAFISNMIIIPQISLMITILLIYIAVCSIPFVGKSGYILMAEYVDILGMAVCKSAKALAGMPLPDLRISPDIRNTVALVLICVIAILVLCYAAKRYYAIAALTAVVFCTSYSLYEIAVPPQEIHCIDTNTAECVIFRDGNSVSVYKADGDSSLAVIGFCERYGFDRLENVVVPVTDIELIHFFERLYDAGCSIEKVICCNLPADKERFREYLASNGTLLEITDYNESVFAGDMKLCVKRRDYTSYFAECESGDIKLIYSTNLEKAQYAEPIDISGADIVVLNGESDTFECGFDKEAEYFLFDHSKYSDEFKDYVKDMKIYDTADANVYIFTLNDGKISIRSMTYGI